MNSGSKAQSKCIKNETSVGEVCIRSGPRWLVLSAGWERQGMLQEPRGDSFGFSADGSFPAPLSSH